MTQARPAEATAEHSRLLKLTLETENSRTYWGMTDGSTEITPEKAFENFLFGDRSLGRLQELLPRLRARFDAFPPSLEVLHRWTSMPPETRRVICHWHVQLSDPLYRRFSGDYLPGRLASGRSDVTKDVVVKWVGEETGDRWSAATRIQYASKLLSAAHAAGLVRSIRDPRPLAFPQVPDEALEYLLYLLRGIELDGSLLDNPYLRSVGLEGHPLEDRLRGLRGLRYLRHGKLRELNWRYSDLRAWAEKTLGDPPSSAAAGGLP